MDHSFINTLLVITDVTQPRNGFLRVYVVDGLFLRELNFLTMLNYRKLW